MNFNEFVQYSFTIQPTTTSPPRADLEGDMWVWTPPPENSNCFRCGITDNSPRTPVGNIDFLRTPWNIFLDPLMTMHLSFLNWKEK